MVTKPKISPEQAEEVIGFFKKAVDESDVESVAKSLNLEVKDVQKLAKGKASKSLVSSVFETMGGTMQTLQSKLDEALGRTPTPSPAVAKEFRTETTGPGRDKPGGPLVPAGSRSLDKIRDGLVESEVIYDSVTKAPVSSETAVVPVFGRKDASTSSKDLADLGSKAKSGTPGKGVSEITPDAKTKRAEGYRTEAERAVDAGIDADVTSQVKSLKKPAVAVGVTTAAAPAGYMAGKETAKATIDIPLAEQAGAGQTIQAAELKDTEEMATTTDIAVDSGVITPEQGEQLKSNIEKVKTVQDLIKEIRKENKAEKLRLEWLQAIETIAHGLATAIGANALLNRGSPFAVDFSKGPQVDWESQFNRLQKDFDTQINAILRDEELQQKQKQFEAREARRAQERAEDVEFRERRLAAEQAAGEQKAAAAEQAKQEKLSKEAQAQYKKSMAYYGDLSRAVEDKKPGAVLDALANLGADEETTTKVREAMDRGFWDKILNITGIKESPTAQEAIQELRPKSPSLRGAEEMVTVSVNGNLGQIPKSRLEEFKKQYPNAEVK